MNLLKNDIIDDFDDNVIRYIGGFVTRRILGHTECEHCKKFLTSPGDKSIWHQQKEYEGCSLFTINDELATFFKFVEQKVRCYFTLKNILKPNFVETVVIRIITSYIDQHPNAFSMLRHDTDHRYSNIKSLCHLYVYTRLSRFIKERNISEQKKNYRKRVSKMLHFHNQ